MKKKKVERNGWSFLVLPVLTAVWPILSFYASNISELSLRFLKEPIFYSITTALVTGVAVSVLIKNKEKASLIVSLGLVIFFSYGHISGALNDKLFIQLPGGMVLGPDKVLLPIVFGSFIWIGVKILRSAKDLTRVLSFLKTLLLILVFYQGVLIVKTERQRRVGLVDQKEGVEKEALMAEGNWPDVYYIVLDGYAREDVLREIYDYDNSEFVDSLRKIGFYVADQARSNYIHTYLSLPSTLNMRYMDELPEKYGLNPADGLAAKSLAAENEVNRKFKNYGYTVINFASSWEGTDESYQADITYKKDEYFKILGKNVAIDETNIVFLQTTLLSPLIKEVWGDALRSRISAALQKLPTIPYQEERKFVVAHLMSPHPPYVFTAGGGPVIGAEFETADEGIDRRPKYLDQLIFMSKQIILVIEKIIENSPTPPIIILQSDHGPASIFGRREEWLDNYSEEGVKERSSILYAVYFPDQDYEDFYSTITPVNTFRILFNKYFNENLEILPDRVFYTSYEAIYDFKEVTEIGK
jgi:hypothetical protein